MKALTDITAGRTASRALLIVAVLTAGIVGTVGTAAAESMDGKGSDPYPEGPYSSLDGKGNDQFPPTRYSLDGKGNDVYPLPVVYAVRGAVGVNDGTGSDGVTDASPINNFTVSPVACVRCGGRSGKPSF